MLILFSTSSLSRPNILNSLLEVPPSILGTGTCGREDRPLSSPSWSSLSPLDEGLRWSTERLSVVFDRLVERVPIAS